VATAVALEILEGNARDLTVAPDVTTLLSLGASSLASLPRAGALAGLGAL
jgi:hypothetical protein